MASSTPLPPNAPGKPGCAYDPSAISNTPSSQPRISPIAHFVSAPNDGVGNDSSSAPPIPTAGRLLAVNSSYVAYAVKKGLVRVIDRKSTKKTLLRGHDDGTRIVDASFFGGEGEEGSEGLRKGLSAIRRGAGGDGGGGPSGGGGARPPTAASDILATVGGAGDAAGVLIWRIYDDGDSLNADKLIEVRCGAAGRMLWHPFDPNRFVLMLRNRGGEGRENAAGTMVETKRLATKRAAAGHAVCECPEGRVPGATQFVVDGAREAGANDASWSGGDARHVLTAHDDGRVRLWDVALPAVPVAAGANEEGGVRSFRCVAELDAGGEGKAVTRVIFLSRYETSEAAVTPPFVAGTDMNHTVTLWSGFAAASGGAIAPSRRLHVFRLKSAPPSLSTLLSVELCPAPYRPADTTPSSFLLLSEKSTARMHALHLDARWKDSSSSAVAVSGFDYVTTLDVVHPILSLCVASSDDYRGGLDEERDVDLCCVQTKAVQMLSLTGEMCAAPKLPVGGELADGVTWLEDEEQEADEEQEDDEDDEAEETFEEDYDIMEDDAQEEVEYSTGTGSEDDIPATPQDPTPAEPAADPFSNWLGAIVNPLPPAAVSSAKAAQPPPPPPGLDFMFPPPPGMTPSASAPLDEGMSFLSPMQLLGKSTPETGFVGSELAPGNIERSQSASSAKKSATASTNKKKKDAKKSPPPQPVAILQREDPKKESARSASRSGSNVDVRFIEDTVERVVSSHLRSLESRVVDAVRKTVAAEAEAAVAEARRGDGKANQKLEKVARDGAERAAKEAVASMQAPIVAAVHQTMREVMIPAYEAATGQMFHQISLSVEQGLAQIAAGQAQASNPALEAMSSQMMKMSEAIQTLTAEIAQLKAGAAGNNGGKPTAAKAPAQPVDARQEILALCQARRYEEAFTKAVSAANGDIVVFTCKHADIHAAFNGDVTLSQTILICLMQQLGAVLVSVTDPGDFKIITMWLQEIAVTIDPTNENIKRHVGSVVQQLLSNINNKQAKCDPAFRRSLQTLMQVIRGLL